MMKAAAKAKNGPSMSARKRPTSKIMFWSISTSGPIEAERCWRRSDCEMEDEDECQRRSGKAIEWEPWHTCEMKMRKTPRASMPCSVSSFAAAAVAVEFAPPCATTWFSVFATALSARPGALSAAPRAARSSPTSGACDGGGGITGGAPVMLASSSGRRRRSKRRHVVRSSSLMSSRALRGSASQKARSVKSSSTSANSSWDVHTSSAMAASVLWRGVKMIMSTPRATFERRCSQNLPCGGLTESSDCERRSRERDGEMADLRREEWEVAPDE